MKKSIIFIAVFMLFGVGLAVIKVKKSGVTTNVTQTLGAEISQATTSQSNNTSQAVKTATFTTADIAKHNNERDCWTIINGNVYNITSYVPIHPGGVSEIVRACGIDSTELFNSIMKHGRKADNELVSLKIGTLN